MKLSVIICTYNRAASLARTLRSVGRQRVYSGDWEVLVVDNNCTDNTSQVFDLWSKKFGVRSEELAGRHCEGEARSNPENNDMLDCFAPMALAMTPLHTPHLTLVVEPRQGLSNARNRGIAESRGELLAIIDDDVELAEDFVEGWMQFFAAYPDAVAAGGRIAPLWDMGGANDSAEDAHDGAAPHWMSSWTARPIAGVVDYGAAVREFPHGKYPIGANMAFRREALTGLSFDPALGRTGRSLMAGEEKDLFARLRARGAKIYYNPASALQHVIPAERLTISYLRRVSRMFGVSERVRTGTAASLPGEVIKWGVTIVLGLFYLLTLRPARAYGILVLRWNVTMGLVSGE